MAEKERESVLDGKEITSAEEEIQKHPVEDDPKESEEATAEKEQEPCVPFQDTGGTVSPSTEGRLTPATDNSGQSEASKSCSGSGRVTPVSQSDVSFSWSSSEKSTPIRKKRGSSSTGRHIEFDNVSTSSGSVKLVKVPVRPGITWKKGERIEAMDFMHKWYPAKFTEINEEDEEVLIHFEGWNQRYDEWIKMTSDRIRPVTRHSDRKDSSRKVKLSHKVGEKVYAKWTDCKMYPARINAVLPNGAYEVVFYDGFKRVVQSINITEMPSEVKQKYQKAPVVEKDVKTTKKSKDSLAKRIATPTPKDVPAPSADKDVKGVSTPRNPFSKSGRKEERKRSEQNPGKRRDRPRNRTREGQKKSRLIVAGSFLAKPQHQPVDHTPVSEALVNVKSEPVSTQTEYSDSKMDLSPAPVYMKTEMKYEVKQDTSEAVGKPVTVSPGTLRDIPIISHQTVVPPKAFVVESDHNQFKCMFEGCSKGFRKEHLLDYHIKYYHTDGSVKPSPPQPTRKRRKTTSICSTDSEHSSSGKTPAAKKHRHVSAESCLVTTVISPLDIKQEIQTPVPSDSEKTDLIKDIKMEEAVAQTPTRAVETLFQDVSMEFSTDTHTQRTPSQDTTATEESQCMEAEDVLERDEVVNCICEFYEENGLMIQCEVCMCWQHACCFGISERTLPKKYVCFVCENPPGVRASSRFLHEQDWYKNGKISAFGYLATPASSEERCRHIKATHSLVADLHHLNRVLHSLKQQLKILRTRDERELKLWRVDWDMEDVGDESMETSVSSDHSSQVTMDTTEEPVKGDNLEEKGENSDPVLEERSICDPGNNKDSAEIKEKLEKVTEAYPADTNIASASGETDNTKINTEGTREDNTESLTGDEKAEVSVTSGETVHDKHLTESDNVTQIKNAVVDSEEKPATLEVSLEHSVDNASKCDGSKEDCDQMQVDKVEENAQDDPAISDSTESALDEDPTEVCERHLLQHIVRVQTEIDSKLDLIEEQVSVLETLEATGRGDVTVRSKNVLSDVPLLKHSLKRMNSDLSKVKRMAEFHH